MLSLPAEAYKEMYYEGYAYFHDSVALTSLFFCLLQYSAPVSWLKLGVE